MNEKNKKALDLINGWREEDFVDEPIYPIEPFSIEKNRWTVGRLLETIRDIDPAMKIVIDSEEGFICFGNIEKISIKLAGDATETYLNILVE